MWRRTDGKNRIMIDRNHFWLALALERKLGMEAAEEKRREDKMWYLYHATRVSKN